MKKNNLKIVNKSEFLLNRNIKILDIEIFNTILNECKTIIQYKLITDNAVFFNSIMNTDCNFVTIGIVGDVAIESIEIDLKNKSIIIK